jgi:hypothetical protein
VAVSWKFRSRRRERSNAAKADDLKVKDEQIDGLLQLADGLVQELRLEVGAAQVRLRRSRAEGDHDVQ